MPENQKRAVIYCRVSTQEQTQRDALAVQVQEAQNAVKSNEWVLVDQYIEMESGTTKHGRSEYMRLLDDIKDKNKFDIIVIKSLDRLNRSAKNWYLFVEELVNNDKLLYIYMDRAFYKTDDRLISGVKAILAEQYSRDLSSKINNAHEYRQKNGTTVLINNNTYGYVKNPDKSVSIHPEEAEMIRKIYRLAAQGCGSRTISKILYQDGIRNRNGNQLEESSIRRIIKNPLFKGIVVMNKRHFDFEKKKEIKNPESEWIYHQGLVPAIVEEELWEKANKMLKLSAAQVKGAGRQKKHRELYDFSGKLICGECGAPYYKTFRRQYSNPEHVIVEWRCSSYLKHGRKKQEVAEGKNQSKEWGADEQELRRGQITGCDNIHLKQEGLERMMRELSGQLFAWQDEENMIRRIIKILSEVLLTGETHLKKEEVEKNLMAVRNRKSRLLDLLLDNTISKQGYKSKQKELEQEEQRWTERLERMDVEEEKIRQTKERLVGIEQKLRADGCEKIQAGLLMQVMDHIRVFEDRLEIELNPVALPGVASVHGWIMQKPGPYRKITCRSISLKFRRPVTSPIPALSKRRKKKVSQISSEKSRFSPIKNWQNVWMLRFLPCAAGLLITKRKVRFTLIRQEEKVSGE